MPLSWQQVQAEALRRIQSREWPPEAQIPNEADLAEELGCSRATVNRALRALADAGWIARRRKAGSHVLRAPLRRAQLAIPLIRQEIAAKGAAPSHRLLRRAPDIMPDMLRAALGLPADAAVEHVETLYLADGRPYALEDRWVHLDAAPGFSTAALDQVSANEWLVQNAPFAHGSLDYGAAGATGAEADHLGCAQGTALLILERRTFGPQAAVTCVRLAHAPGHQLRLMI